MISYKEYKKFNESVGLIGGTLGLKGVQGLGLIGSQTKSVEEMLEEAKKKAKKMLAGTGEGPAPDETGDGEVVPPKAVKDKVVDDEADVEGDADADVDVDKDVDVDVNVDKDAAKLDTPDDGEKPLGGVKFSKKKCKKESTEFATLWDTIQSQRGQKSSVSEEILLPDNGPNANLVAADAEPIQTISEPSPDEAGVAPQQNLNNIVQSYLESAFLVKKK